MLKGVVATARNLLQGLSPFDTGMDNENTSHNEVMNADEAALFLKLPKSTLLKLTSEGQIPGVKVGRGWRFNLTALENWKNASGGADDESGTVGEPVELDFDSNLANAETQLESTIKPVIEETPESEGDYDFDSLGEVRELEEEEEIPAPQASKKSPAIPDHISEGLGEVRELEEEPKKPKRGRPKKSSAVRTTSALELMARISEKSSPKQSAARVSKAKTLPNTLTPKRRGRPPRAAEPVPEPVVEAPAHKTQVRETIRETVRETSQEDAVEISRPYNPSATAKRPDFSAPRPPAGNSLSLLRKLSYWVVVLAVLALAAFGIKGLLVPTTTEPQVAAVPPQLPTLPEFSNFDTVYRHNDNSQPGQDNFKMPDPTPAPEPAATADPALAPQITAPEPVASEPVQAPGQVALKPVPAQEVARQSTPISTPPPVDKGLESINRILPALFDLSGCSINSSNNEIRIVFQEGIFSSGVSIGSQGRTQLARVAEFLNANAPDFWVIIEGQTDSGKVRSKSPFRDNYTLGLRRAIEATAVMREEGNFPADRLLASSAGGLTPPFPENQPGGAARNRTVVLRLVPKSSPLPAQNQ